MRESLSPLPDRNGLGVSIAERVTSPDFDPQGNPTTAGFSLTTERITGNGHVDDYELILWGKVFEANPQQGGEKSLGENIECTISPKGIHVAVNWGDYIHLINDIVMLSIDEFNLVDLRKNPPRRNLLNPPYFIEYHIDNERLPPSLDKQSALAARVDLASNTLWRINEQILRVIQSGHVSDAELRKIANPHFV